MVHGAMIAVQAAAAGEAKKKVVDEFRIRGATAPERALPLPELGLSDDASVGELISSGVIRGVDPRGRPTVINYEDARVAAYYLDEGAYIAHRDRGVGSRTRAVLIVLAIVGALLLLPLMLLIQRG